MKKFMHRRLTPAYYCRRPHHTSARLCRNLEDTKTIMKNLEKNEKYISSSEKMIALAEVAYFAKQYSSKNFKICIFRCLDIEFTNVHIYCLIVFSLRSPMGIVSIALLTQILFHIVRCFGYRVIRYLYT